jgi:hypothetical protein
MKVTRVSLILAGCISYRQRIVRDVWDRVLDFAIAAWLGLLDCLAPLQETPVVRRQGGARR